MLSRNKQPSTRPVAEKVKKMVSYCPCVDQNEVVAPQSLLLDADSRVSQSSSFLSKPEVVAPQCLLEDKKFDSINHEHGKLMSATRVYDHGDYECYGFLRNARPNHNFCLSRGLRPHYLADEDKCRRLYECGVSSESGNIRCKSAAACELGDILPFSTTIGVNFFSILKEEVDVVSGSCGDRTVEFPKYPPKMRKKALKTDLSDNNFDIKSVKAAQKRRGLSDTPCGNYLATISRIESRNSNPRVRGVKTHLQSHDEFVDDLPTFVHNRVSGSWSVESDDDVIDRIVGDGDLKRVKSLLNPFDFGITVDTDRILQATRMLTPLCTLMYQLYNAGSKTSALVAAFSYLERMAVEDDYNTVKVGITWMSGFVATYKEVVSAHLENAYEYLTDKIRVAGVDTFGVKLQSTDVHNIMGVLESVTSGVQHHSKAQSFVWLVAFIFTSIGAARTGVFPDFNNYSRQSVGVVNKIFMLGSGGVTVCLFIHAVKNCTEFVNDLLTNGLNTLWTSEIALVTSLKRRGLNLLERSISITVDLDFNKIVSYGFDLEKFMDEVSTHKSKFSSRSLGTNILGVGFTSESNTAIVWASVSKIHTELLTHHAKYKVMMAGIAYRRQPFAVAAVGGSSLGKSLWVQATAATINLYLGVEHDPRLIYTVNPGSDYFDGYKPYQTITVMDDVATLRSNFQPNGDVQVKHLISMINNVPFLTPQADLPDKKTCPFLSRALLLTSNTADLDAHVYANNPAALLRRVRYRVTLQVAPDFVNASNGLDAGKASAWQTAHGSDNVCFPPFWVYTVEELRAVNTGTDGSKFKMDTRTDTIMENANTQKYLSWFRNAWVEHEAAQDSAVAQVHDLKGLRVCTHCSIAHPYHADDCPLGVNANVAQSDDNVLIVEGWYECVILHSYGVFVTFMIWCFTRLRACVMECFNYVGAFRDRVLHTCAAVEDTCNHMSHMALVWRSIGTPLAIAAAWLGIGYSWLLAFPTLVYFYFLSFPMRRVRSLMTYKTVMVSAATLIASGIILKKIFQKENKHIDVQSDNSTTCDFSYNDAAAVWGDGQCRPFAGESRTVAMSPASGCTRGSSLPGALKSIEKTIFVAKVTSAKGSIIASSVGNGFVYSMNPPVVGLNKHTFAVHQKCDRVSIKMLFLPGSDGVAINDDNITRPMSVFNFEVDCADIHFEDNNDLAMIYVPGLTRTGCRQYFVREAHCHGGMGPELRTRDKNGNMVGRKLENYRSGGPQTFDNSGTYEKTVKLTRSYVYDLPRNPTDNGDSGSLLLVFKGDDAVSDTSGVGIAGFHVGVSESNLYVAPLSVDLCDRLMSRVAQNFERKRRENVGPIEACVAQCLADKTPVGVHDHIFDLDKGSRNSVLQDTHPKAAINWVSVEGDVGVNVFGSVVGDSRHKQGLSTNYLPAQWSDAMSCMEDVLGDVERKYTPTVVPRDSLWKVHHRTLKDLLRDGSNGHSIPNNIADNAVVGLVDDIVRAVKATGNDKTWANFGVLSYAEAVNGRNGHFDAINWKTGGGFGYNGPKYKVRQEVYGGIASLDGIKSLPHYQFDDKTMISIESADALLRKGVDPGFVYTTHLKDEIRTIAKVNDNQIRMICGASVPAIVLMRKYLMPIIVFMQQNPLATECAVGINVESNQWDDLAQYMREYGEEDRYIAGDYKNFDKNQTLQISVMASRVMYGLVLYAHSIKPGIYSSDDLLAIHTLLFGLCYPKYDHFGVILGVCGTNPSGNSITAQRNCIANSLYTRCAFIWLAKECLGVSPIVARNMFARVVRQINYGDDILQAIRSGFHWFNHDTLAYVLGLWGVPFTHADKTTGVGRPYDHFREVTFVKRSFVFNEEIGGYLAPLDKSSVVKSLYFVNDSACATRAEAHAYSIRAAAENVLSHGRDVYDTFCDRARILVDAAGLYGYERQEALDFCSWDSFVERWRTNSVNKKFGRNPSYAPPPPYTIILQGGVLYNMI